MNERKTKAKNVILFLGDGMDLTTITAARILKGQRKGNTGPEDALMWDKFDHVALSKVSLRNITNCSQVFSCYNPSEPKDYSYSFPTNTDVQYKWTSAGFGRNCHCLRRWR